MSVLLFDGVSRLVRDGNRITSAPKTTIGKTIGRVTLLVSLLVLEAAFGLATWDLIRRQAALAARAGSAGARPPGSDGSAFVVGGFAVAFAILLALFAAGSWRRWQRRRTVFDLDTRVLLDADGAQLARLDDVQVSVRPHTPDPSSKAFGNLFELVLALTGTPGSSGNEAVRHETFVYWSGGERSLTEPSPAEAAEALAAKLAEAGITRSL